MNGPTAVEEERLQPAARRSVPACLVALLVAAGTASAQDKDELARKLANPIASLTSVPLQLNVDDGLGADDGGTRVYLNVQPVVPVSLSEDWNLISRTIVPVFDQQDVFPGAGSQFGLGDVVQSVFVSPKALTASGWTWGVGPVLLLPTATDDLLGTEKWGAGPTAVALRRAGRWDQGPISRCGACA